MDRFKLNRFFLIVPLLLLLIFCSSCKAESITVIRILKVQSEGTPVETSLIWLSKTGPHPTAMQQSFNLGDELMLGFIIDPDTKSITFTKYTYLNTTTQTETTIISDTEELGPFKSVGGDVVSVHKVGPWSVPFQQGSYELRIYVGQKVIASALFEVN